MAGYREHITVAAFAGVGYGLCSVLVGGFTLVQAALAGWLAAIGGMAPDLDSPTSKPVRELFGLVAAIGPLIVSGRILVWLDLPAGPESVMLTIVVLYLAIRYGGVVLVSRFAKHRGMFHSLPALIIAAEIVYLTYPSESEFTKLLMGGGVATGFLSHLVLDEVYSVDVSAGRVRLKKSSGTALKWSGPDFVPNVLTYCMVMTLSFVILNQWGWIAADPSHKAPNRQPQYADQYGEQPQQFAEQPLDQYEPTRR